MGAVKFLRTSGRVETISLDRAKSLVDKGEVEVIRQAGNIEIKEVVRGWREDHATKYMFPGEVKIPVFRPGELSVETLRKIYKKSSTVRPCVDALVRTISNFQFRIFSVNGVSEQLFQKVNRLFENPNLSNETFRQILQKLLLDLLVLDAAFLQKVRNLKGEICELYAIDAGSIKIEWDGFQITKFVQSTADEQVEFSPNELVYFRLFPSTFTPYGQPIIETIVSEVASLLLASKTIGVHFAEDEIPPGILQLGEIGEKAFERLRMDLRSQRGPKSGTRLAVLRNVQTVNWIPFKRPFREMQVAELLPMIERIVYRNFGWSQFELGEVREVTRATAQEIRRGSYSKLIMPIVNLIADLITQQICAEFSPDLRFIFVPEPVETPAERSAMMSQLFKSGLITVNEARKELGFQAVEGGDILLSIPPHHIPGTAPPQQEVERQVRKRWSPAEAQRVIQKLERAFRRDLATVWDRLSDQAIDLYERGRPVEEIIQTLRRIEAEYLTVGDPYFVRAANHGRRMAIRKLRFEHLGGRDVKQIVDRYWESVRDQMERSFFPWIEGLIRKARLEERETIIDEMVQVGRVLKQYCSSIGKISNEAVKVASDRAGWKVAWVTAGDSKVCVDCVDKARRGPYSPRQLNIFPRSVQLKCKGNCRCLLEPIPP